jgi:hypothetical protein
MPRNIQPYEARALKRYPKCRTHIRLSHLIGAEADALARRVFTSLRDFGTAPQNTA